MCTSYSCFYMNWVESTNQTASTLTITKAAWKSFHASKLNQGPHLKPECFSSFVLQQALSSPTRFWCFDSHNKECLTRDNWSLLDLGDTSVNIFLLLFHYIQMACVLKSFPCWNRLYIQIVLERENSSFNTKNPCLWADVESPKVDILNSEKWNQFQRSDINMMWLNTFICMFYNLTMFHINPTKSLI